MSPFCDPEDALQDAIVEQLEQGNSPDTVSRERVAELYDLRRRKEEKRHAKRAQLRSQFGDVEPNPENVLIQRLDIQRFLAALDEETRDICKQILQGATIREIAKGLGVGVATIHGRLRALGPLARDYGLAPIRRSTEDMDEYGRKFQRAYTRHQVNAIRAEFKDLTEQRRAAGGEQLVGHRVPQTEDYPGPVTIYDADGTTKVVLAVQEFKHGCS